MYIYRPLEGTKQTSEYDRDNQKRWGSKIQLNNPDGVRACVCVCMYVVVSEDKAGSIYL